MFSVKIKELRTARNIAQEDMANFIGVSTRTYMDYENGKNEPKISKAKAIANALGVPLSELLEENNKTESDKTVEKIKIAMEHLSDEDKRALRRVIEGLMMTRYSEMLTEGMTFDW